MICSIRISSGWWSHEVRGFITRTISRVLDETGHTEWSSDSTCDINSPVGGLETVFKLHYSFIKVRYFHTHNPIPYKFSFCWFFAMFVHTNFPQHYPTIFIFPIVQSEKSPEHTPSFLILDVRTLKPFTAHSILVTARTSTVLNRPLHFSGHIFYRMVLDLIEENSVL